MSRIRKFNENTESFLDIIKHETYVLTDLKLTEVIQDLNYFDIFFEDRYNWEYFKDHNFIKEGVLVRIGVNDGDKVDFNNMKQIINELCHIKDKLELDYNISKLNIELDEDGFLLIDFKICKT